MVIHDNYTETMYKREPGGNAFVLPIALNVYEDIFNEWDPVPFKTRDLSNDLKAFLLNCSSDIPMRYKVKLSFRIKKGNCNDNKEKLVLLGLRTFFAFNKHTIQKRIRQSQKRSILFVMTSGMFLISAITFNSINIRNSLFLVLNEGLYIGGWIFLWEAISTLVLRRGNDRTKYLQYKRFCDATIEFQHV